MLNLSIIVALGLLASGCALPKPHFKQSRSYEEFVGIASSQPQFQWAYCGSDLSFHHFAQWRYGAVLGTMGRSSYLKLHRVLRSEITVADEFTYTENINQWRLYSLLGGDRTGEFSRDFLREGDTIPNATN